MFRPGSDTKGLPQTAHLLPGQLAQVCERSRPPPPEITGKERTVAAGLKCPFLKPGDIVEAEISGIGILRTPVVAET